MYDTFGHSAVMVWLILSMLPSVGKLHLLQGTGQDVSKHIRWITKPDAASSTRRLAFKTIVRCWAGYRV